MGYAALALLAVGGGLFGFAVYWRVKHTTFCEGCKRPAYKCSCAEDGLGDYTPSRLKPEIVEDDRGVSAAVEQAIKMRRKPLDK